MLGVSQKRGQLTLFIVIAVVIVALVVGIYFFRGSFGPTNSSLDSKSSVVEENLISCFNSVYQDSVELVGAQGGYYNEPLSNYETLSELTYLPYYLSGDNVSLPSVELMELEIQDAIDSTLDLCLREVTLSNPDLELYFSEFNSSVQIKENSVDVLTKMNLGVVEGNQTVILKINNLQSIPSKILEMQKLSEDTAYYSIQSGGFIPADWINSLAKENGLNVLIAKYSENVLILSITPIDQASVPSVFNFLVGISGNSSTPSQYSNIEGNYSGGLNPDDFEEAFV